MTDFYKDMETGKQGERMLAAALAARGHNVQDVSSIREYQRKDIDFVVSHDNTSTTLEVKNDVRSNSTGNVYIETYCQENVSRYGDGWYYYCEADYLAFVQQYKCKALIISRNDLIELINSHNYRILNKWDNSASGYIVPITDLQKCKSYIAIDLKGENNHE